ncbi:MAG: 2-C-methyl-D-erythritol 4-phosphate cytidylyltransferase [Clostridiales bacterium]|nr:2-C-methyl-D-erythritol 4-phosphate cytidylyltransferase [Clostridiales bacterium]
MSRLLVNGKEKELFVSAVVAAAGSSSRFGEDKLFLLLDGMPTLARSIDALQKSDCIDEIIVSTSGENLTRVNSLVKQYAFTKVTAVCEGGKTRAESVKNAVDKCSGKTDIIAIHDGARPFVTADTVRRTVEAAASFGAAACAVKVKDTVKIVDENETVKATPEREFLRAVQTPQAFSFEIYKKALENAPYGVTDDCMTVEAAGQRVVLVEGEYTNIKITTPDDISLSQAILKGRAK